MHGTVAFVVVGSKLERICYNCGFEDVGSTHMASYRGPRVLGVPGAERSEKNASRKTWFTRILITRWQSNLLRSGPKFSINNLNFSASRFFVSSFKESFLRLCAT